MFEPSSESPSPPRPPLAPPVGPVTGARPIFWNEHELRAGWRLLVFVLLFVLLALGGTFLTILLHLPQLPREGLTAATLLVQEGVEAVAALAAGAIMALLERRPFGKYGLPGAGAFGARFWQGVAWGILMITAVIFLIRVFGGFSFGGLALRGPELWGYAALWAVAFLSVGFFEEFFFRGYVQFTLATGVGFWPAATLLSAAFGALHIRNRGEDAVGALGVFVIGMFFCLTLRRTGSLWFAVGLHAAFDWGETFLYSVPDSGVVAPGHLLNSSLHGPVWLTGGTVGPEASVMAFVVVALAALLFARLFPSRTGFSLSGLPNANEGKSV
jgi:membrane protease YdiL (CAAX protease family)